jgi:steroid delta-isomerase-like uncharacterized protein
VEDPGRSGPAAGLVRRFYDELWNQWRLDVADEILAADLRFRGTLDELAGRDAFKAYAASIRAAFPDWHNQVDELFDLETRVITRMTWSGTHRGPWRGIAPTGRRVVYPGAAFFTIEDGRIRAAWIVGDTSSVWAAMERVPPLRLHRDGEAAVD